MKKGVSLENSLTIIALMSLLLLYSFVVHTRIYLGDWPRPWVDDITINLIHALHGVFATLFLFITFISPLFVIVKIAISFLNKKSYGELPSSLLIYFIVYIFWFIILFLDPGGYLKWMLD